MPLALILVDAFSASYPEKLDLPFLQNFKEAGKVGAIQNMFAYRGIEATIFSGATPSQHGVWGEYQPRTSCSDGELFHERLGRFVLALSDIIPVDRLRLSAHYIVDRIFRPQSYSPLGNLIPAEILPKFIRSMEKPVWEDGSLKPVRTIFDWLRQAGLRFETVIYPHISSDSQIPGYVRAKLNEYRPEFWYIKFTSLDELGHFHGPDVNHLGPELKLLSKRIMELIRLLKERYSGDIDILLLGDHGMSTVSRALDIRPAIREAYRRTGKDRLCFIDSTSVRFWGNRNSLEGIKDVFNRVGGLRQLSESDRVELLIPDNPSIGDLMYVAEEGTVLFPDYFRRERKPKGMHGYAYVHSVEGLPFYAAEGRIREMLPASTPITHAIIGQKILQHFGMPLHQ